MIGLRMAEVRRLELGLVGCNHTMKKSKFKLATRGVLSFCPPLLKHPSEPKNFLFLVTPSFSLRVAIENKKNDKRDTMGSAAYQNPSITVNSNIGNVIDSYKNVWNNCEISVPDEKRQILEWLSPLAPRERHRR